MRKNVKYKKTYVLILILTLIIFCFCIYQNNSIMISYYEYKNEVIGNHFNDFKIVHISDLHNKLFGKEQENLLYKLKQIKPDIIVITGDIVDRRKYNLDVAMIFIQGATNVAPIYYVSGNHEAWSNQYTEIKKQLESFNVVVLEDEVEIISKGEEEIIILGLKDPDFLTSKYIDGTNTSEIENKLQEWSSFVGFKILLSHRPELFDLYAEYNIDVIFSGHAHGGQIRIPFIGGVIAPDQGMFPKYTSGFYNRKLSTMYVSRGLGNSVFPVRVFNRPEILVVNLKSKI